MSALLCGFQKNSESCVPADAVNLLWRLPPGLYCPDTLGISAICTGYTMLSGIYRVVNTENHG